MINSFYKKGYCLIPNFYDVGTQIDPILKDIQRIIEIVAEEHGVNAPCGTPQEAMTSGIMAIAEANRTWASEIYDAVKQIPSFMQLMSHEKNIEVFKKLRTGSTPGLAAGGYGIRIDFPSDEKFRTFWHQDFPAQLRSLDGLVFWTPLLPMTTQMGPVEICVGSQSDGFVPVIEDDGGADKTGAYALRLHDEKSRVLNYNRIAPLTKPGDLLVMDFLTLHQSGINSSDHPRWSMQSRWFNYENQLGRKIAWKGSFAAGVNFAKVLEGFANKK